MPILQCYVSDETLDLLNQFSRVDSMGRDAVTLAEDAISEAAIAVKRELPPSPQPSQERANDR
jgi:hypothetical protein